MNFQNLTQSCRLSLVSIALLFLACDGIDIYDDEPKRNPVVGQLYVNATSWTDWYYVSLDSLQNLAMAGDTFRLKKAQTEFTPYPIPMTPVTDDESTKFGQYTYWFDVFGKGLQNNEFRNFVPTSQQPEPQEWTLAFHRNNVRTNDCGVCQTEYNSIEELLSANLDLTQLSYKTDEWSENEVWDDQSQMMRCLIASQGIAINKVLSSWLTIQMPPMPPAYIYNNKVFILKMPNDKYAALQLKDYRSTTGVACCLTINYRYPL